MTEGFAFGYDDLEECDETTEEDLEYLKDTFTEFNTAVNNQRNKIQLNWKENFNLLLHLRDIPLLNI